MGTLVPLTEVRRPRPQGWAQLLLKPGSGLHVTLWAVAPLASSGPWLKAGAYGLGWVVSPTRPPSPHLSNETYHAGLF